LFGFDLPKEEHGDFTVQIDNKAYTLTAKQLKEIEPFFVDWTVEEIELRIKQMHTENKLENDSLRKK